MGSNPTPCRICFFNRLQWRNRLAHGTYRQYKEICRGCEFEPHLEHQHFILTLSQKRRKSFLPDRESNPGLPRDRRRSSPLDYRGLCHKSVIYLFPVTMCNINDYQSISYKGNISKKKNLPSFEPDLNQRSMDIWCLQLQSTALPIELSKVVVLNCTI